jgi:two-component system chemotaxis sensor kinase CheA
MGAPVYRLRGKLLPLVYLDAALGLRPADGGRPGDGGQPGDGGPGGGPVGRSGAVAGVYVAVVAAEGRRFGLVVDRVLNTEEVVVKPLTGRFTGIGVYAGATLLGDGAVALILDVAALARRAHLAATEPADTDPAGVAGVDPAASGVGRLLVAAVGARRVAIPLDLVTRLEEFPTDRLEYAGGRSVVQYRGQILPVLALGDLLGEPAPAGASVPVIVSAQGGRSVALAVDAIVDIVDAAGAAADASLAGDGLLGAAVIAAKVTDLLDVRRAIQAADPHGQYALPAGAEAMAGTR